MLWAWRWFYVDRKNTQDFEPYTKLESFLQIHAQAPLGRQSFA